MDKKPFVVVLTGAGISAESGLQTFRDAGGLWEGFNVMDVATPEAWSRNPQLVQEFYNLRRKAVLEAKPNPAHLALKELESAFEVQIITQNIDDLHERAGSSYVSHLHGVITKSQSSKNPALIYDIPGWELKIGEYCELGSQLRPHVVWFGELVPMMEEAVAKCSKADVFIVIGTSLQVYPAAGLVDFVPEHAVKYLVDLKDPGLHKNVNRIYKKASDGVPELVKLLLETKKPV